VALVAGMDLGSRWVKLALMEDGNLIETRKYDTIEFYRRFGRKAGERLVIDFAALGLPSLDRVVSTGYGRLTIQVEGAVNIPEIRAHLLGANFQTGLTDYTLLDLGGQDSKVILVRNGKMADFITNDRCAASSGRYVENMAAVLGVSLAEMGRHTHDPVELSSTCAVFGESELVGRIIEGHPIASLAAGVNYTIFRRVLPMLLKLYSPILVFTGGVAYNKAIGEILARELEVEVVIPPHPQFNGAIGCCLAEAAQ